MRSADASVWLCLVRQDPLNQTHVNTSLQSGAADIAGLTTMPTSELSDALNPYYAQPRPRPTHLSGNQRPPPALQPATPQHATHRSELELAISEPPRPPATPPTPPM